MIDLSSLQGSLDFSACPKVIISGKEYSEKYQKLSDSTYSAVWFCQNDTFSDELIIEKHEKEIVCRRLFKNISEDVIHLNELCFVIGALTFKLNPKDDYFYHNENPRIYEVMTFPIDYKRTSEDAKDSDFDIQAGNRWADPGVISERIGASPYQPFPAILVGNYNTNLGLVHGTLSQKYFFHNYIAVHDKENRINLKIYSSFKATSSRKVEPDQTLEDVWYLGITEKADDIEQIFSGYTRFLRKRLQSNYGATSINRNSFVWGSWNDGIWRDISQDMLLKEAEYIKQYFPQAGWLQVDDGYASYNKSAHGIGVPYEKGSGIDNTKFPGGLKQFTQKLREKGLRPAIWIGCCAPIESPIFTLNKDWFIDYSHRMKLRQPFDVSLHEVREYMAQAVKELCYENGFEGIKLDFWSYPFEDSGNYYKDCSRSGYEWRRWWLQTLRENLPSDGYLQTGCDIVMGNPFLGEFFTNYRYGIDVGTGNWDHFKTNLLWGSACFATQTSDLFVPNSDAVGIFEELGEREFFFWLNYCLVTRSMVEISGRFSRVNKEDKRLKALQKATCCPDNGQNVHFINFDYRSNKNNPPEIFFNDKPYFSTSNSDLLPLKTLAFFNYSEQQREYSIRKEDLRLKGESYILTNVWTREQYSLGDRFSLTLEPHESAMFSVSRNVPLQIFDSNIKIENAEIYGKEISFDAYYPRKAELLIGCQVKEAYLNSNKIKFSQKGNMLKFTLQRGGKIKLIT